jgi:DNA-binding NarL/FixJ family response regulator
MNGGVTRMAAFGQWCDDQTMTTVLIVDDHDGFRRRARALLEADGYEVVGEAACGADALTAAASLHPQLVLLDVQLPDFDGFEVARRLQHLNGGVDIVLTSSRDLSDYGSLVSDSPVRGFVPKAELSGSAIAALLG